MIQRDALKWTHDLAETLLLVGALVAFAVYVIRDRRSPIDMLAAHAGIQPATPSGWGD